MPCWVESRVCWLAIAFAALAAALPAPAAIATTPARPLLYETARRQGLVGERVDGYLGFVVAPSPQLQRLVRDINIKRKALYIERAKANAVTAAEYAFVAGCLAIARTLPGEKYQAPDGTWRTRGAEPPVRDRRCP